MKTQDKLFALALACVVLATVNSIAFVQLDRANAAAALRQFDHSPAPVLDTVPVGGYAVPVWSVYAVEGLLLATAAAAAFRRDVARMFKKKPDSQEKT